MRLAPRLDQLELRPKLRSKARAIVPLHRKAAAFLRAIKRKCRDDGVAAGRNRRPQALDISGPVARIGQEVKCRAIVPDVVAAPRPPCRGVGNDPVDC